LQQFPLRALEALWHEKYHILEDVTGVATEGGWPEGLVDCVAIQDIALLIQSGVFRLEDISIAGVPLIKKSHKAKN